MIARFEYLSQITKINERFEWVFALSQVNKFQIIMAQWIPVVAWQIKRIFIDVFMVIIIITTTTIATTDIRSYRGTTN